MGLLSVIMAKVGGVLVKMQLHKSQKQLKPQEPKQPYHYYQVYYRKDRTLIHFKSPSMKSLLRFLQVILLSLVIGVGLSRYYFAPQVPVPDITKDISIITEKIEHVSKMVMVEGTFSEIYSYEDAYKMLYSYLSFEKKAILKVNAKAALSVDLRKLEYDIDAENKKIILQHIPDPEMMIEPDIQYYDIQESRFNEFSVQELNQMNRESINQIREMIRKSNLFDEARIRVVDSMHDLFLLADYLEWEVIDNTQTAEKLRDFDGIRIIEK